MNAVLSQEKLVELLEPLEKRYKQDYSDHEREILYRRFSWMTSEMWKDLCGLVLAKNFYRIPAADDFTTIQMAHRDKFRRIGKVHEPCDTCRGTGIRMFLQRRWDRKHVVPPARCECRNGENWPQFPSVEQAEALKGWVRWLGGHESASEAVAAADRAVGVGEVGREAGEESEVEEDKKIPF